MAGCLLIKIITDIKHKNNILEHPVLYEISQFFGFLADHILILSHGRLIRQGTPADLIAGLEGVVWEKICQPSDLPQLQRQFEISRIETTADGILARFVGEHPDGSVLVESRISLEDVYLHYNGMKSL